MSVVDWCCENNISEKKFYYWQRSVREKSIDTIKETNCKSEAKFVQLPAPIDSSINISSFKTDMVIHVWKHSCHIIDAIDAAKSSAIIYNIAETAQANNLKPYNYSEFLLREIPKYMEDTNLDFLNDLFPYSEQLPAECKKQNK